MNDTTQKIAAEAAKHPAELIHRNYDRATYKLDWLISVIQPAVQSAVEKATEETVAYWQGVATQEWHKGWAARAEAHEENKSRAAHADTKRLEWLMGYLRDSTVNSIKMMKGYTKEFQYAELSRDSIDTAMRPTTATVSKQ